jgi:hypothetical protein
MNGWGMAEAFREVMANCLDQIKGPHAMKHGSLESWKAEKYTYQVQPVSLGKFTRGETKYTDGYFLAVKVGGGVLRARQSKRTPAS